MSACVRKRGITGPQRDDRDLNARCCPFQLRGDVAPTACTNFRGLCTGEFGTGEVTGKLLSYRGCRIHAVIKDMLCAGGDFEVMITHNFLAFTRRETIVRWLLSLGALLWISCYVLQRGDGTGGECVPSKHATRGKFSDENFILRVRAVAVPW